MNQLIGPADMRSDFPWMQHTILGRAANERIDRFSFDARILRHRSTILIVIIGRISRRAVTILRSAKNHILRFLIVRLTALANDAVIRRIASTLSREIFRIFIKGHPSTMAVIYRAVVPILAIVSA